VRAHEKDNGGIWCLGICFAGLGLMYGSTFIQIRQEKAAIERATAECMASGKFEDRYWSRVVPDEGSFDGFTEFSGVITREDQCDSRARRELGL
jgi:hypothetical protein